MEFCKIYFLTKFDPESIRMNLHTSSAPFWNGTSVSNLLIMSNLLFFGFYWLRYAKPLCSFFWIRFYTGWVQENWKSKRSFTSEHVTTMKYRHCLECQWCRYKRFVHFKGRGFVRTHTGGVQEIRKIKITSNSIIL